MLKLKLQYFGHLMRRADSLEKSLMLGKIEGRRRRGRQSIKDYKFVGKTIYPFCTNEEGSLGLAEMELKSTAKGAIVKPGFACKGSEVYFVDDKLANWLK